MQKWLLGAASVAVLAACGGGGGTIANPVSPQGDETYRAEITRTTYGVPHIKASDFGSLGFGQGYAFAQDNLCVFLEDLLTIRGERSKYFGPDGTYRIEPNGSNANNVDGDFFWKSLFAYVGPADNLNAWEKTREKTIPDFRNVVTGYVAGFNKYIGELQAGDHDTTAEDGSAVKAHAACADAAWLQPIEDADMYRRFVRLSVLASSSVFTGEIGSTQPPPFPPSGGASADSGGDAGASSPLPLPLPAGLPLPGLSSAEDNEAFTQTAVAALQNNPNPFLAMQDRDKFGSNMYAFGKDGTQDGQSLVYGNPHFPWRGTERLYLSHATLEKDGDKLIDIMGVGLYGVPAVLIGFNEKLAWSHTVSTAYRFTLYQLQINPLNPLQYMKDGEAKDLIALPTEIEVLQPDGSLTTMQRTLYRSEYGPMISISVSGVPVLGWTPLTAFSMRDANLENDRLINQFASWNMAKNLDEFIDLHGSVLGVPWVNTVAAGPDQAAYYGDVTVVPHVTDEQTAECKMEPFHTVLQQIAPGLPVLDGSRTECDWGNDADAPAPGVFGKSNLPTMRRDDYVHNCNDSYWLTNPAEPITGFDRIIGDENAERTLRTRLCILQAERRLAGSDEFDTNPKMTQDLMKEIALNSEIYSATITKQNVLDTYCQLPGLIGTESPEPVQTAEACAALEAWDGKTNLDSRGAHLWREFWFRVLAGPALAGNSLPVGLPAIPEDGDNFGLPFPSDFSNPFPIAAPTNTWVQAFSTADPVNTPNTLNPANPFIEAAFADAIRAVANAGVAFDAPLSELQFSEVHTNEKIAIFGGSSPAGAFTIARTEATTPNITADGYKVEYGNSYIQAVTWVRDANGLYKPQADAMLTYSQSTDPANPHFDDYTKAYAAKEWLRLPFTPAEIAEQKIGSMVIAQ